VDHVARLGNVEGAQDRQRGEALIHVGPDAGVVDLFPIRGDGEGAAEHDEAHGAGRDVFGVAPEAKRGQAGSGDRADRRHHDIHRQLAAAIPAAALRRPPRRR